MSLTLPPLNALRAFEAAARAGSYVAAAQELNVSPAAISQHIRNLEDFLGKHLFTRLNNRVVLTDAGAEIFENIHRAFEEIAASTARAMGQRPRSRLVISALSSMSECWLAPQLGRFAGLHPEFRFELRVEADPVDFGRDEIDLRLTYGSSVYDGMESHVLHRDVLVPIGAPLYLKRLGARVDDRLTQVPEEDLIHTDWGADFGSRATWNDWFHMHGAGRSITRAGHQVSHSNLALQLARRGMGVVLGQRLLAAEMLASGELVLVAPHTIPLGYAYNLVHPRAKAHKPMLKDLMAFLLEAAAR